MQQSTIGEIVHAVRAGYPIHMRTKYHNAFPTHIQACKTGIAHLQQLDAISEAGASAVGIVEPQCLQWRRGGRARGDGGGCFQLLERARGFALLSAVGESQGIDLRGRACP